jgi:hypothetical protein
MAGLRFMRWRLKKGRGGRSMAVGGTSAAPDPCVACATPRWSRSHPHQPAALAGGGAAWSRVVRRDAGLRRGRRHCLIRQTGEVWVDGACAGLVSPSATLSWRSGIVLLEAHHSSRPDEQGGGGGQGRPHTSGRTSPSTVVALGTPDGLSMSAQGASALLPTCSLSGPARVGARQVVGT